MNPKLTSHNYDEWFRAVRASIASQWWPCFDPEGTQEPPRIPTAPDEETPSAPSSSMQVSTSTGGPVSGTSSVTSTLVSTELSNEDLERELLKWTMYSLKYARYKLYAKEESKIMGILDNTVPPCYYPKSVELQSPRWILKRIKASLAPSSIEMRRKTRDEHTTHN